MSVADDARFMGRALAEAAKGRTRPNPRVGAVVVKDGEIIAVGHHAKAGADHAEVAALKEAGEAARGATLYCTLEPCNHFGRTPPCTDAIIRAQMGRVVIGCADPAPHVPGATKKMRDAGVEVVVGVRETEARRLIEDFAHHIVTKRPFTVMKAAVTLDGRIATRTGSSQWITGEAARTEAHRMRDRADAVAVGVETVLADDPSLTVRHVDGQDPIRVVLDSRLRTPPGARMLSDSTAPVWIVHGPGGDDARKAALREAGAELIQMPLADGHVDLAAAWAELGRRDLLRVLVEGGGVLHGALLQAGLVQRVAMFVAPVLLGDAEARPVATGLHVASIADGLRLADVEVRRVGDDVLIEGCLGDGHRA